MKKFYFYGIGLLLFSSTATAQFDRNIPVDYEKFPNYKPVFNPEYSLLRKSKQNKAARSQRPAYVNNAETPYFPAIFNQDGGSCSSAASIAYMLTYELNSMRNTDATIDENMLPTHFTWSNYFSPGQGQNAIAAGNGVPNIIVYGGRTYSRLFGSQDWKDTDFGWMQGYDKWYSAMFNRTTHSANIPLNLQTEEGREIAKDWLWNHCGDNDFPSGGALNVMLGITGSSQQKIPSTPTNTEIGTAGLWYIDGWGIQLDHQMTIIGYDDRVEFDLDGNGIAGEKDKDEVGAWIIANSWGSGWCNNGFIYCPYARSYTYQNENGPGGWWTPEMHFARKNYRPLRTMKVTMEYSKRSEIALSAGISTDLDASEPEATVGFKHFIYAGNGGNEIDAETPMLGRWADGMHYEPMEFGYDLTDLSAQFDTRRPLKYFFIIDSKSTADGEGKVHGCSVIDYEFDTEGLEVPFKLGSEGVTVENKGNRTIISCIIPGEPIYAPRNLERKDDGTLVWQEPASTPYRLMHYNLYRNDSICEEIPGGQLTAETDDATATYTLSAVYDVDGKAVESGLSNRTLGEPMEIPARNTVLSCLNSGFTVPNIFEKSYGSVTIEYWLKPSTLTNWNQHIGKGWGTFLLHANSNGSLSVGWGNDSYRINTVSGVLRTSTWAHIAVVIKGNSMKLYVNGENVGETSGAPYSGLGGFGSFEFGSNSTNEGINGSIDEVRIWKTARSQEQIRQYMNALIANPSAENDLLAYYNMSFRVDDGTGDIYAVDQAGGNDALLMENANRLSDNALKLELPELEADFAVQSGTLYAGSPVQFTNQSSPSAVKWEWNAPDAGVEGLLATNPQLIFGKAGTYNVTLKAYGSDGSHKEKTSQVVIEQPAVPNASFTASAQELAAGDRVTFSVDEYTVGCTYEWSIPGAEKEKVYTTNAAAVFKDEGTYTVTLKVTNSAGESAEHSMSLQVKKSKPQSGISVKPSVIIKGETVYLEDQSKYSPESWNWELSNPNNAIIMNGQTGSLVPQYTGVYDATLVTQNEMGKDTATVKRALTVCNADGKNGLRFDGSGQYVQIGHPFAADRAATFTVALWMNPNANSQESQQIGDSKETFLCEVDAFGAITVHAKHNSYTTERGIVVPGEWHHYAIGYANGYVSIFKDAELVIRKQVATGPVTQRMDNFRISGSEAPMDATVDEFQIWSKVLTADQIMQYANYPIEDVAAAEKAGLRLYYNFNEVADEVADLSSNKLNGIRIGFGPTGDAWSSTKGIFCLSETKAEDVTADYLTNYEQPFLHTDALINGQEAPRFQELETGTEESGWILENSVPGDDEGITTQFFVDGSKDNGMALMSGYYSFAKELQDHKAYQVITLPAGKYTFSLTTNGKFDAGESFLAVAKGETLPDTRDLEQEALSYASLADTTLEFSLNEETRVALGIVANLEGSKTIQIANFRLMQTVLDACLANGETGIENVGSGRNGLAVHVENGSVRIDTGGKEIHVQIVSTNGTTVFSQRVNGEATVRLDKGIYIINGTKVAVF